jgi:RNA polymerase sigma-70 factor (ECF subfamily)
MASKRESFEQLALPLMDQLYTVALYLARNPDEADDLLQETYLRAYRFWERFASGTNCKAWLVTILYNVFRNRYRERQKEQPEAGSGESGSLTDRVAEIPDPAGSPELLVLSSLLDGEVDAALRKLPRDFLDAIVLVDVEELSYEEAAEALGCPVGTVRSRLSRGRNLLHDLLSDYARERGLLKTTR